MLLFYKWILTGREFSSAAYNNNHAFGSSFIRPSSGCCMRCAKLANSLKLWTFRYDLLFFFFVCMCMCIFRFLFLLFLSICIECCYHFPWHFQLAAVLWVRPSVISVEIKYIWWEIWIPQRKRNIKRKRKSEWARERERERGTKEKWSKSLVSKNIYLTGRFK